jgi:hypothetical protein
MSRPGARAASRLNRSVQSEPLVLRMLRSEFSAAIVARPSGWLTSTFRMAICRDTYNSTPQRASVLNVSSTRMGCLRAALKWGMRAKQSCVWVRPATIGMTLRCQIEIVASIRCTAMRSAIPIDPSVITSEAPGPKWYAKHQGRTETARFEGAGPWPPRPHARISE